MPTDRRHTSSIRKLAAIMFTDIVGYTALMGKDEDKAFNVLARNKEIHNASIKKFNGSIIKEIGDGILASFPLASEAVRCAIEIQKTCIDQEIPLKIGIHEGETIFAESDVMGDTVNIASRLQEASTEGCIFISDTVYRSIKNKTDIQVEFVEERTLKNVDELVKVYNVNCEGVSTDSPKLIDTKYKSPKQKSIIVLPFENMSPDPDQEYFSDGLTEEIITDLSYIHDLLVISRSSAMTFKGTKKKIKEIAREVNVRYVLEGSVRKAGNNLRIVAQLIDGTNDSHLWADKYTGTLDDVFDIQEKVSRSIVDALKIKLTSEETKQITNRPIDNIQAYECHLRAIYHIWLTTPEALEKALKFVDDGLRVIGENELLYADKGQVYAHYVDFVVGKDEHYIGQAEECIKKIFKLNPDSAYGHFLNGLILRLRGNQQEAVKEINIALKTFPDNSNFLGWLGWIYGHSGKFNMAQKIVNKLNAMDPLSFHGILKGCIDVFEGNFDSAIKFLSKYQQIEPENPFYGFWYGKGLAYNKNIDEALIIFNQIIKHAPGSFWEQLSSSFIYALQGEKEKAFESTTKNVLEMFRNDEMFSIWMAEVNAMFEEKDKAIDWLEYGINWGFINYPFLNEYDPFLENIRGENRFKKLMESVKYKWENFEV